jgi:hypothetical protein
MPPAADGTVLDVIYYYNADDNGVLDGISSCERLGGTCSRRTTHTPSAVDGWMILYRQ